MVNRLLSAEDIQAIVAKLAKDIDLKFKTDFMIVALMDGAFMFAADLLRALYAFDRNPMFETLSLSSYGDNHMSSGHVRCLKDIGRPVEGMPVLIVDDVFESGHTLDFACRHLSSLGAESVTACVFARKPFKDHIGISPEFIGWEAPNKFLVGYGLDDAGRGRGLPFIGALD